MVLFGCEWCKAIRVDGDAWILGLAAESIGITSARREITILPAWDDAQCCHPLAVHFCSAEHKDKYMAAMFETEDLPEMAISTKARAAKKTAERRFVRTGSTGVMAPSKKKRAKARRAA